jgi:hypothetical protein
MERLMTELSFVFNGKTMVPGTEFAVSGERGARFRFLKHVTSGAAEWIDCVGGKSGHKMIRSFRPDRISRITRLVPSPLTGR